MLSNAIKDIRQRAFVSQEEFAKELSVSVSTINRWETGKLRPNLSAMKRIKKFCDKNGLPFSNIEDEWRNFSLEDKK